MWLLLQLSDGTFPSGGFAHSAGLEASMVLGAVDLNHFLDAGLRQAGSASLPFVRAAARGEDVDNLFDSMLPMRALNRASRAQGRALVSAATRVWPQLRIEAEHHAVVFGTLFGKHGVAAAEPYLHGVARTILSSAVRLGLIGPLEAQQMLAARAPLLGEIVAEDIAIEDAAATTPLIEMYAALHERLDGRMFQS